MGRDRAWGSDSGDILGFLADRQTDTQTDILITILATTPAGKVIYSSFIHHKGRSNNETNKQADKKRKT